MKNHEGYWEGLIKRSEKIMTYEEWYKKNEEELHIKFAETGMDRELDFNIEDEFEKEYEKWKQTNN